MLASLSLALAMSTNPGLQDPARPPASPPIRTESRVVFVAADPDGENGLDRDGDGFVSRAEFARPMDEAFAGMDANGDGRLSSEELQHRSGAPGMDHDVRVITMGGPEMSWTSAPEGAGPHRIELRRAEGEDVEVESHSFVFVGQDGEVTTEGEGPVRILVRRTDGLPITGEHRVEWISEGGGADMDANGDGRVTEAEFLAPMREMFGQLDADGSGVLEEGERGGNGARIVTRTVEVREED
ncbi:hypothetical protein [Brevundimonas sp.]|uniref:hypothetical protein n=1 Tax=Brevundimonas sp. TaxID=1871086 RepID=UPI0035158C72